MKRHFPLRCRPAFDQRRTFVISLLITCSLLISAGSASAQANSKARATAEQLTLSLMDLHRQYQTASPNGRQAIALELHSAAAKRQQLLTSLVETNPGEVLRVAIPAEVRNAMPDSVRSLVEQHVKLQGQVEVTVEDGKNYSRIHYGLGVAGQHLELHFAGKAPTNWLTDMNAQISGVQVGNHVALTAGDATVQE